MPGKKIARMKGPDTTKIRRMKILLVGPYPPPHGGVSVHLAGIERRLDAAGIPHQVLDTSRRRSWAGLVASLLRLARDGWTVHFHSNGHNWKDWSISLVCGIVGRACAGSILTLHSGLAPEYLARASFSMRRMVRTTCALNNRVIAVSPAIRGALLALGIRGDAIEVAPACLGIEQTAARSASRNLKKDGPVPASRSLLKKGTDCSVSASEPFTPRATSAADRVVCPLFQNPPGPSAIPAGTLDANLLRWIQAHRPLISTALFFRPEYGFEILVAAIAQLRRRYPSLGCLVMGSGEDRKSAEKLLRDAGLEASVLLAGDVEHDTCLTLMALSDVFVRPTLRDGDSISLREALGLGVPVVASRTGFRPRGAILFEPGDSGQLVAALELAMKAGASEEAREPASSESGSAEPNAMDRLIAIYRQTVASESAYGAS